MKPGPIARVSGSLRLRLLVLMAAGVLFAGVGFEVLLVQLTRHWLGEETEFRARTMAMQLGERSVTSLAVGDSLTLAQEVRRAVREPDVEGIAIYRADGLRVAQSRGDGAKIRALGPLPRDARGKHAERVRRLREDGHELIEVIAPVLRQTTVATPESEASRLFGLEPASPSAAMRREHVGWVRMVVSLDRAGRSVATAARAGLLVLLVGLLLGMVAVGTLVRVVVRPLREASGLAQAIAAGELDRRLPVRGHDELGALAGSMNRMAGALQEARASVESEAKALRTASEAVVAIARGVRTARDPDRVFRVVAREVQRVTGCDGVALAEPDGPEGMPVFVRFDPALPWATLAEPLPPDPAMLPASPADAAPRRLVLAGHAEPLARALSAAGFATALSVPLALDGGAVALVLLVSCDAAAFPPAELDVVAALASHLSAALHAGRLNDRLQDAFEEVQRTHEYLVRSEMLRVAGEMATGVAHEFNNVLGAILGRAQLLSLQAAMGDLRQEDLIASLAVIERAARDGRETGRRLRNFGRGEGESDGVVNLAEAVHDAVEFTRPRWENEAQAAGRQLRLDIQVPVDLWVRGRGHEMREVFTNLLLNAIDAMPTGGAIRVGGAAAMDERVMAVIEDEGTGMTEEVRRRAFEPFFTTKGADGNGLGLSVAYGVLQRSGATIEIESAPGRGTRIEICFPAAAAPAAEAAAAGGIPFPAAGGERPVEVLVVDDETAVRDVVRDMVVTMGHRATSCASGEEALAVFEPGRFDLVLTDLGMPGMTGWALTERLRSLDPGVTVVFVTGWGESVQTDAVRAAGASLVIAKPFNFEDIAGALRLGMERPPRAQAA